MFIGPPTNIAIGRYPRWGLGRGGGEVSLRKQSVTAFAPPTNDVSGCVGGDYVVTGAISRRDRSQVSVGTAIQTPVW